MHHPTISIAVIDEIQHTLKWGWKHTRDGLERTLVPSEFREINDRVYTPTWIRSREECVYLGIDSRYKDEYFAVRKSFQRPHHYPVFDDSTSKQSISVSPPETFTSIDIQIVDVQDTDTIKLCVSFTHPNGEETKKSVKYELSDFYLHEGRVLPVSLSASEPAVEATIELNADNISSSIDPSLVFPKKFRQYDWKPDTSPRLSIPAPRGQGGTPIFLISVDTFRYDALDAFNSVVDELGDDAVIPAEPRTQGNWTRPAHASMFTGVHPGTHGYVGTGGEKEGQFGIPSHLTTLPELLANNLYKCSGCVTREKTGIEYGFGRGMHQYSYKPISWMAPEHDGSDSINQVIQWVDRDRRKESKRLFYFLHLFDPHYPYAPTVFSDVSPIDCDLLERFKSAMSTNDYLKTLENPSSMSKDDIELIKSYYYRSVRYIGEQITRLIQHLKRVGLYSDALFIITGDHGEDFFERQFAGHNSVTDANIRPGMIIKPPADSDFEVPDNADIIDILPTIAQIIGADIPEQCDGVTWHGKSDIPRITERIRPDWYTIAVEINSTKGIFLYHENYPNCPTESQIEDGPIDVRFYDISSRTSGKPLKQTNISDSLYREFESIVKKHIKTQADTQTPSQEQVNVSAEAKARLEQLGYK
jgi:arylsulfatase A-like enzyme